MFRVIKTAQELQDLFTDYVEDNKTKGYVKRDNVKSGENAGQVIEHLVPKPLSVEAFCLFADIYHVTFKDWCAEANELYQEASEKGVTIEDYVNSLSDEVEQNVNTDKRYRYYSPRNRAEVKLACSRIRGIINDSLTGGGVSGLYNPSLVAAIVGLKNTEEEHNLNSRKAADINININGKAIDLG
jgi:hypothetical protein